MANRIWHIGRAFFVEAEQADLVNEFRKKHVHQALVFARHDEHMGSFLQQILSEGLATEF